MQVFNSNTPREDHSDEIDLRELYSVLLEGRWIILSLTGVFSIIGVMYSLLLPNIYESRAVLVPVNPSNGSISSALGAYSGLAGLAGISLPSNSEKGNSVQAIQKIKSLSFFTNNIMTNIHLPDLMAVKSWDSKTNRLAYDNNIYNSDKSSWVRDYSYPRKQIPSAQESFEVFKTKHLSISEDKQSGFIFLSIKHQSPIIAKQWTELIVNEVNKFYRQKDKSESEKAVSYLNKQILVTDLSEIKQVLAKLLQEETKKLTLIEANNFYVFEYIDPPALMENKSEPKRALICIFIAVLGGIISTILILIRHYFFKKV